MTQLWREIKLAMHDQEEISTRTTTKMISMNTWACSKAENEITENVKIKNTRTVCLVGLMETWTALSQRTEQPDPDLTGNQIPCR